MTAMNAEAEAAFALQEGSSDPDWTWLREAPTYPADAPPINVVDLFAGCGAMTFGLAEAARRTQLKIGRAVAVEMNVTAGEICRLNTPSRVIRGDVRRLFLGQIGEPKSRREHALSGYMGRVDVLLGGPPCQGHSDLNNYTRRNDARNGLYGVMARAAEVLKPAVLVVENVPPVMWDAEGVVEKTQAVLESLGYAVAGDVVDSAAAGVPQARRRFILVGSRIPTVVPSLVLSALTQATVTRTVGWAIQDLVGTAASMDIDKPSIVSSANRARIAYLTEHALRDLPNTERPACHRDNPKHSYRSMYGRLAWTRPAQTITTGFTSMGQGRFVHPSEARTLTPHEAARLQTIPDWFDWGDAKRTRVAEMIGNAVPPLLMAAIGEQVLPGVAKSLG